MATALATAQQPSSEMSLNVPPEFERAVRQRVESGLYASIEDVFTACLKALNEWEDVQRAKFENLRAELQIGIDQADRGQLVDGREGLARIRERYAARLRA